jgi:hypothetical protein
MAQGPDKKIEDMTVGELAAELKRLKDNLCDLEDMHSFTFGRTSVHIGATKAQNMQEEYEEECRLHNGQIAAIEALLKKKGAE